MDTSSLGVPPTAAVLSGIDLLMNPKKRSAGSDIVSIATSLGRKVAPDATVRQDDPYDDSVGYDAPQQAQYAPPPQQQQQAAAPPRPFFYQKPRQQQQIGIGRPRATAAGGEDAGSVYSSSASTSVYEGDDGGGDQGDDEDDEDDDDDGSAQRVRRLSPEEEANQKRDVLYQFDRIERKGVRLPRRFTMEDPLDEMRAELERLKIDRELDVSVRFQRKMLMACVTGIELLNGRFDPFDVKLDGWSDSMHESVNDYDEVFEDLHMKYRGKAKMAPELKLMFMVGGSGVMFHLTNSMFRQSSMPGLEQVMRQNPALMRQVAQATMAAMQQQQQPAPPPPQQPRGGGGLGGMFGGLMGLFGGGGGGGGAPQQQQQAPPPPPQPRGPAMRGPKHVDDILRDLHRDAFSEQQQSSSSNLHTRVEIVSNASDSELSELPDDAASVLMPQAPTTNTAAAATGGRKPRAARRGKF